MPLTAIAHMEGGNKLIDITDYNNPKSQLALVKLSCQECGHPMHIRVSFAVRAHFAHNPSEHERSCSLASGESAEHRAAKIKIRDFLKSHDLYKNCRFQFEYTIADNVRRADLVAIFPDGLIEAHEIQLSGISLSTLVQRTQDYERRNIAAFWWLGERANKDDIKSWLYSHYGQFGTIQTGTKYVSIG